ncbi:hypothetical protein SAY86_030481 [Trapa natans]|uniref:Uncharacterized protein n=1 Tax=Trapa natans TaxID=22666 RepID=A0AAN7RDR2_TRANT|nr:hypothetical protein SAY86_030481 [Trapa natans]
MVLLEKLWDDVVAGPQPERGLGKLRKITTMPRDGDAEGSNSKYQRSMSMPANSPRSPGSPQTPPTPTSARMVDNVWRSVFHPGSNIATKTIGSNYFDKPTRPNCPTVYDWLYSGETRTQHR